MEERRPLSPEPESLAGRMEKNAPPGSISAWMLTEVPELGNRRPIDIIESGDPKAQIELELYILEREASISVD